MEAGKFTEEMISDPMRRRLIQALWHSSEALSAPRFVDEYDDKAEMKDVEYHLRQLEGAGVVEVARVEDGAAYFVLGGANASEAVRRLGLSASGRNEPRT
jgi:DNA-binding transcriptional ArsR family regulator